MPHFLRPFIASLGLALAFLGTGATARAGFTAHLDGITGGESIEYTRNGGSTTLTTTAGRFEWSQSPSGQVTYVQNNFSAFCIDLAQNVQTNQTFEQGTLANAPIPGGGMGTAKAAKVTELFQEHYADLNTPLEYQAFQVALWNLVWDNDLSVSKYQGQFYLKSDNAIRDLANTWLGQINGTTVQNGPVLTIITLTTPYGQDMVTVAPPPSQQNPAPAPPALILALAGIVPCLAFRRRLRGQAA